MLLSELQKLDEEEIKLLCASPIAGNTVLLALTKRAQMNIQEMRLNLDTNMDDPQFKVTYAVLKQAHHDINQFGTFLVTLEQMIKRIQAGEDPHVQVHDLGSS